MKVAVVGAGIAGLTAAAALQRGGHTVEVLESRDDSTSGGAGISIWPNALAALDDIGLGDAVRAAGYRVVGGAVRRRDGRFVRHVNGERMVAALGEPLVVVERTALSEALGSGLRPGTVRFGAEVKAIEQSPRLVLADRTAVDADLVVGADGIGSVVATALNGRLARRYTGYVAWRGIADFTLDESFAGQTLSRGCEVGHLPLGSGRTYWFAARRLPEDVELPDDETVYLTEQFGDWPSPIPELIAATPADRLFRNQLHDRASATRWTSRTAVLIGDAAHPMRPHLGQGGCQGIEDAVTLAAMLHDGADLADTLARFERRRRRRVAPIVAESRSIGRALTVRPPMLADLLVHASSLVPGRMLMRHLRKVAGRSAWESVSTPTRSGDE